MYRLWEFINVISKKRITENIVVCCTYLITVINQLLIKHPSLQIATTNGREFYRLYN